MHCELQEINHISKKQTISLGGRGQEEMRLRFPSQSNTPEIGRSMLGTAASVPAGATSGPLETGPQELSW